MYKIMLVDDEVLICEGLFETIDFMELGFSPVGIVSDPFEALQLAEQKKPDLVITDINMPVMNGLVLAEKIREIVPTAQFVALTGYDDYKLMRSALQLKMMDYILKPVTAEGLVSLLKNIREKMDDIRKQYMDITSLRKVLAANLPMLQEMFLARLLAEALEDKTVLNTARQYELNLENKQLVLAVIDVRKELLQVEDLEISIISAQKIAKETLAQYIEAAIFRFNGNLCVLLPLQEDGDSAFWQAIRWLNEMKKTIEHYLGKMIMVGVGAPCYHFYELKNCVRQALSAIHQRVSEDEQSVLLISDLEPGNRVPTIMNKGLLHAFSDSLKLGDERAADRLLGELLYGVDFSVTGIYGYQSYLMEILLVLMRIILDAGLNINLFGGNDGGVIGRLFHKADPVQAEQLLTPLCHTIINETVRMKKRNAQQYAVKAKEFLDQNFCDEGMGIDAVAVYLHVSSSYIAQLFKKEFAVSMHQYMLGLRMDKAMALLLNEESSIADIAMQVGISDANYFSYTFKKRFGSSPSQVRRRKKKTDL